MESLACSRTRRVGSCGSCLSLTEDGLTCVRDAMSRAVDWAIAHPALFSKAATELFFASMNAVFFLLSAGEWLTNFGLGLAFSGSAGHSPCSSARS